MRPGNKTISRSMRPQIETIKSNIRAAVRPFDGTGSAFKTAIKELRAEGVQITYVADKCHYVRG
ncbi:MAG: hypothetical protein R3260_00130 [Pseudomonas sp.]|nr:hypothetical protein [Pseudomonas sp.]